MSNAVRWCIVPVPSVNWAKKIFPNCSDEQAVDKLWDAIAVTMRLNEKDPVKAWKEHNENSNTEQNSSTSTTSSTYA